MLICRPAPTNCFWPKGSERLLKAFFCNIFFSKILQKKLALVFVFFLLKAIKIIIPSAWAEVAGWDVYLMF
jgi:hypothetical protein